MPFEDFTQRKWVITESNTPCKPQSIVLFAGTESDVKVTCNGEPYGQGTYASNDGEERIERKDEYSIAMVHKGPERSLVASFAGVIGGSWTAEDNTTGDGGDA